MLHLPVRAAIWKLVPARLGGLGGAAGRRTALALRLQCYRRRMLSRGPAAFSLCTRRSLLVLRLGVRSGVLLPDLVAAPALPVVDPVVQGVDAGPAGADLDHPVGVELTQL